MAVRFVNHALSRDNYEEEIKAYGEKMMLATEKYLPKTYKKMVENWKGEII